MKVIYFHSFLINTYFINILKIHTGWNREVGSQMAFVRRKTETTWIN